MRPKTPANKEKSEENIIALRNSLKTEEFNKDGKTWLSLAKEYINIEDYENAIEIFRKCYKLMPENIIQDATYHFALCSYNIEDYTTSEELCKRGILKDARYAEHYCLIGKIHYDKGNYKIAKEWYERALKIKLYEDDILNKIPHIIDEYCYKEIPERMLRSIDFHLNKPPVSEVSFLLPVHESDISKKLMPDFLESWKWTLSDDYATLYIMNNGCGQWLNDLVEKFDVNNCIIVDLGENLGFIGAINEGIDVCKSKYIGFLNTDVFFKSKEWLPNLISVIIRKEKIGGVGYNNRGYKLKGKMETAYLEFSCALFRREALDDVGTILDEKTFGHGYFEDDDLCIRLLFKGWKLIKLETLIIHSLRQSTPDYDKRMSENYLKFVRKYDNVKSDFVQEYLIRQREFFRTFCPWVLKDYLKEASNVILESKKPIVVTQASLETPHINDFISSVNNNFGLFCTAFMIMDKPYIKSLPSNYLSYHKDEDSEKDINQILYNVTEKFGEDKWYFYLPSEEVVLQETFSDYKRDIIVSDTGVSFNEYEGVPKTYNFLVGRSIINPAFFIMKGYLLKEFLKFINPRYKYQYSFNAFLRINRDKVYISKDLFSYNSMVMPDECDIKDRKFYNKEDKLYPIVHIDKKLRQLYNI